MATPQPKDPQKPYGPVVVGDVEITVDKDACIGASACVAMAAHTYALDEDAKAVVLATADEDSEDAIIDAARACPVQAIKLRRVSTNESIV